MNITNEKLAKLKALAEKATPGQWEHICQGSIEYIEDSKHFTMASVNDHDNAAYIAAASPDVVMALIAEIERLEKEADWLAHKQNFDVLAEEPTRCPPGYEPPMSCRQSCCQFCWRMAARNAVEK